MFVSLPAATSCAQSVITPHVYPPSITMATFLGTSLWEQCRVSFGYLQSEGYCSPERCTRFPIVIGEVGSAFETATDKQWLQDFADFVNAEVGTGRRVGGVLPRGRLVAREQGHGCE